MKYKCPDLSISILKDVLMGDQCIFSLLFKQLCCLQFEDLLNIGKELKIVVYLDQSYTRQFQTSKLIFSFRHT